MHTRHMHKLTGSNIPPILRKDTSLRNFIRRKHCTRDNAEGRCVVKPVRFDSSSSSLAPARTTGVTQLFSHRLRQSQTKVPFRCLSSGPNDDAAAAAGGSGEDDGGEDVTPPPDTPTPTDGSALAPVTVPDYFPFVPVIAVKRAPLFPKFMKQIDVRIT